MARILLVEDWGFDENCTDMRNFVLFCFWIGCVATLVSCHSKAKEYKDVLREGSWYVYDIESEYKFSINWGSPRLKSYVRYLMDEKNLLFLPGDEIAFSKRHVHVRTPGNATYEYRYNFVGDYIKIGDYDTYYGLKPDDHGDNMISLKFDKSSLRMLLSDQEDAELLDELGNLKKFRIVYYLQRPLPLVAQIMSGIYVGELYDGTGQLINSEAAMNLFWRDNTLNLSLDDPIRLEDGPAFYIEVPDIQAKETFTPGSYEFSGTQLIRDPSFGEIRIDLIGRYNAASTVSADIHIHYNGLDYQLQYQKGVRQWGLEQLEVKSMDKTVVLKKSIE